MKAWATVKSTALTFVLPALLLLTGCAGYAALVLNSATLPEARALDFITQHLSWHIRPLTAAEWYNAQSVLGIVALALAGAGVGISTTTAGRAALRGLVGETLQTGHSWARCLKTMPPRHQRMAILALAALTAVRLYFSLTKPLHAEEIASYEFFASKSLLAVSAYYPAPNNHVLSNTISWVFYQISTNFWWAMRLPVLLTATVGTVFLFAGVLRRTNFRVALLATTLFSGLQLSLYNASAGRGYWLLITLAGLVFFAMLSLADSDGRHRAAWVGLLLGGVLGLYTIPTFAYVLASAWGWLGLKWLQQAAWPLLARLAGAGLVVLAGAGLLYTPLLLVSGAGALLGNGFVIPQAAGAFWAGLPAYAWFTEGMLAGQRSAGAILTGVVLLAAAWRPRPAAAIASDHAVATLARPALWFVLFPYLLLAAQRVHPPERVFLYKAFFFFLLLALLVDETLRRTTQPWRRQWLMGIGAALFLGYQLYHVERLNRRNARTEAAYHAAYHWLARQPSRPLLVPEGLHHLHFRYYAHTEAPAQPWLADRIARPGIRYGYVVAFPAQHGTFQPHFTQAPAFRNAEVEIYSLK